MTKNINFAFSIGYIAGLENKLISKYNINKLKKCETVEEFFSKLKTLKYKEINFKDYETFEAKINENLEKTIEELREICPEKEEFEYVFCKNNFLNLKIFLKDKFSNVTLNNLTAKPFSINPKEIEICLKNNSFETMNKIYRKSFEKILEEFKKAENKKQAEILIDKEMYNVLLKISGKTIFRTCCRISCACREQPRLLLRYRCPFCWCTPQCEHRKYGDIRRRQLKNTHFSE